MKNSAVSFLFAVSMKNNQIIELFRRMLCASYAFFNAVNFFNIKSSDCEMLIIVANNPKVRIPERRATAIPIISPSTAPINEKSSVQLL